MARMLLKSEINKLAVTDLREYIFRNLSFSSHSRQVGKMEEKITFLKAAKICAWILLTHR